MPLCLIHIDSIAASLKADDILIEETGDGPLGEGMKGRLCEELVPRTDLALSADC